MHPTTVFLSADACQALADYLLRRRGRPRRRCSAAAIEEARERKESLRNRTVKGVRQELWGIFLAYNLVRREMEAIAGVAPTRSSITAAMRSMDLLCSVAVTRIDSEKAAGTPRPT